MLDTVGAQRMPANFKAMDDEKSIRRIVRTHSED
jgi:hypothetical protein